MSKVFVSYLDYIECDICGNKPAVDLCMDNEGIRLCQHCMLEIASGFLQKPLTCSINERAVIEYE